MVDIWAFLVKRVLRTGNWAKQTKMSSRLTTNGLKNLPPCDQSWANLNWTQKFFDQMLEWSNWQNSKTFFCEQINKNKKSLWTISSKNFKNFPNCEIDVACINKSCFKLGRIWLHVRFPLTKRYFWTLDGAQEHEK